MVYALDTITWRVYSAEQSIEGGATFATIDEAIALGRAVTTSRWWADRYPQPDAHNIAIIAGGDEWMLPDGTTAAKSFAAPDRSYLPTAWRIELHPAMLTELVVLHELAHCVAPRRAGNLARMRRGQVITGPLPGHGHMFAAALTGLVRQFGTGRHHADLADAYAHFEVPVATESELRDGIEHGLAVESILGEWDQQWSTCLDTPSTTATDDLTGNDRPPAVIPEWTWGDELRSRRYRPTPKISQQTIAAAVSTIQRCTRHHIARLEHSAVLPDDLGMRRIAMAVAVFLNLDPIYARHQLGLVRWDCDVDLDELRLINPDWVALVEHLNALGNARPPLWMVPGER